MYSFIYDDEYEFKRLERTLRRYNILAFKKLYFEIYPLLKEGKMLGDEYKNKYELKLPTDSLFSKVHGDIILHYEVYEKEKNIKLIKITPEDILKDLYHNQFEYYKGVPISKNHINKEKFKIDLLNDIKNSYKM